MANKTKKATGGKVKNGYAKEMKKAKKEVWPTHTKNSPGGSALRPEYRQQAYEDLPEETREQDWGCPRRLLTQKEVNTVIYGLVEGKNAAIEYYGVETREYDMMYMLWKRGDIEPGVYTIDYIPPPSKDAEYVRSVAKLNALSKYRTPEEMQERLEEYFADCDERGQPYTIPGAAYFLGFASKSSLVSYERFEGFYEVVERLRLKVEMQRNEQLISDRINKAGHIFDLKNNHDWKDESRQRVYKEGDSPQSLTINQQNNQVTNVGDVSTLPEAPQSIEEWQKWYEKMMSKGKEPEAIEVSTQGAEVDGQE